MRKPYWLFWILGMILVVSGFLFQTAHDLAKALFFDQYMVGIATWLLYLFGGCVVVGIVYLVGRLTESRKR